MLERLRALSIGKKVGLGAASFLVLCAAIGSGGSAPKTVDVVSKTGTVTAVPNITTESIDTTEPIPYTSTTVESANLASGTTKITTPGVDGIATITYKVMYTDNVESGREQTARVITKQPVTQVTTVGSYVAPTPAPTPAPTASANCDPNYSGACVPIASDVDCAGGSGNGPAYVRGPVKVIGVDIYRLDGDKNGIGCE